MNCLYEIKYSKYHLKYKFSNKVREGALLRFDFHDSIGFADCHPWAELGDENLENQLSMLKKNRYSSLLKNCLLFAHLDAQARMRKEHLLEKLPIPKSHYLIQDIHCLNDELLQRVSSNKFTHIKIKLGNNPTLELQKLKKIDSKPFIWRFDFNSKLTSQQYIEFMNEIKNYLTIELCEDPFFFNHREWKKMELTTNIPLALDKDVCSFSHHNYILVLKPAVDSINALKENLKKRKFYVTSYLDHPFGQSTSAYIAGILNQDFPMNILTCGLLSHEVYQENVYSKEIATVTNDFKQSSGTGFGFDDLLNQENWISL